MKQNPNEDFNSKLCVMHALSNLSLRKKRKDEEFFYIDANLDVENSNILQQQLENPVSGKACSDE